MTGETEHTQPVWLDVDLSRSSNGSYTPGRPFVLRALWLVVEASVLLNPVVTSYRLKRTVLRWFGAHVGSGVIIKPGVHIKHPWRLRVGDDCWIGERAWIDNLAHVELEANVCVSQGAYLCTGNHDWSDTAMTLFTQPIFVGEGAWIGAFARIGPGVRIGREAVVGLAAVVHEDVADQVAVRAPEPTERSRGRR